MTIGERIKYLREQRGWTQDELGKLIGVKNSAIHKYESGRVVNLKQTTIDKLAKVFDVKPSYILGYEDDSNEHTSTWIPVLGRIPAGTPIEAIEDVVDREDIPSALARKGDHFGLRIVGDSMSPVYLDGDTIIVRKQSDCESGEDCVVMINGDDATFKRVIKNENGILLRPLNPDYDVMMFSNEDIEKLPVRIVGVAVEVRRKIGR